MASPSTCSCSVVLKPGSVLGAVSSFSQPDPGLGFCGRMCSTLMEPSHIPEVGFGYYFLFAGFLLSIWMANFGWAHPNRVGSQAVFQKFAGGHPKLRAKRKLRSSTWESSALTASRLGAPRVQKKTRRLTIFLGAQTGHTHRNEQPGGPRGAGNPAPSPCCHSVAARSGPLQGQAVEALLRGAVSGAERHALCEDQRRSGCRKGR